MAIQVETITAPVYWACALINGDESGFDYDNDATDKADYDEFCAYLEAEGLHIVSTEGESYFTWQGTLHHSSYSGVEVIDYVAHKVA
jgi:hypothetical protein